MIGQINVDYAIAVGVFITGALTAISLSFTLFAPSGFDESDSLHSEAVMVSEGFEDEVSDEIRENKVFYGNGYGSFLSVVGVEPGVDYSVSTEESGFTGVDVYSDSLVFEASGSSARILDTGAEIVEEGEDMDLSSSSFSNDVVYTGFGDQGLNDYSYDGYLLVEGLELTDTGLEDSTEGDVSVFLDYSSQSVYFYGGDLPDFYLDSVGESSELAVNPDLDNVETVSGRSYSLSDGFSGSEPLVFYNESVGLGLSGGSMSYSSDEGSNIVTIEGSYYGHGFSDKSDGLNRVNVGEEAFRTVETGLRGVNMSKAENLFDESETVFRNRVGIGADGFRVSFAGMEKGGSLPDSGTVVSRSFEQPVLYENGTVSSKGLEVAVWQ